MTDVDSDILLDLRRGDRQGFVRYFELYRAPVYNFVERLLRDTEDAVSATEDAFTTAYRRILLADGRIDLRAWTFKAAFDVCRERVDGREATPSAVTGTDPRDPDELAGRFAQALGMVAFHHQAVLLLHDISELRPAELATVFGVTEDAVGVLLFRAREAFRHAFEGVSSDQRLASCRLAEQMVAGAVGGSLSTTELQRLEEHAAYCRDCRRTTKSWGTGALGLAMFLKSAPLPKALEAAPVFGTFVPMAGAAHSAAGAGVLRGVLAWIGRAAAGRAAAYGLAAVCLTFALGLAVLHPWAGRSVIVLSPTRFEEPSPVRPARDVARPPAGRTTPTGPSAEASPVAFSARASGSQDVIELFAEFGSPAGASEPVATAATDVASLPRGRLTAAGLTSASATLAAGALRTGNARKLEKAKKTANGAAHSAHSSGVDRGHAQAAAKQKAAKVANQHAQKQSDKQNKNKNKND